MGLAAVVLVFYYQVIHAKYVEMPVCPADSRDKFLDVSFSRPLE